jgi:hypothetical protein
MNSENTTLLVQLPADLKLQALVKAKQEKKYLSEIIRAALIDFIRGKKTTGRGHLNTDQIEKAKKYLRNNHPKLIRAVDLANYVGCEQARAARLLDYLSGGCGESENTNTDFLVYVDDSENQTLYGIFKDTETGIFAQ